MNNGMSRSVFFSDRENAENVQKSKTTVFFTQKKSMKICQWVFQKRVDYRIILREEKDFKKHFKGKENQEGIPGHTCFLLFSL